MLQNQLLRRQSYKVIIFILAIISALLFSDTKLSNHFITIYVLIFFIFLFIIIWYIWSTSLVKKFRYFHNKNFKLQEHMNYGVVFSYFVSNIALVSVILSLSQLKINTSIKSSLLFMIAICTIILSFVSVYKRIYINRSLRKQICEQHIRNIKCQLNRILYQNKISDNYRNNHTKGDVYSKELIDCINNERKYRSIIKMGCLKPKEEKLLHLMKTNCDNKVNKK